MCYLSFGHLPLASLGYRSVLPLSAGHLSQYDKENYLCGFDLRQRRICPQGAAQGETWRWGFSVKTFVPLRDPLW